MSAANFSLVFMNSTFPNVILKEKWTSNLKELRTDILSMRKWHRNYSKVVQDSPKINCWNIKLAVYDIL